MDGGEIPRQQVVAADHFDVRAETLGDLAAHLFELVRAHVLGWRVDQVAYAQAGGQLREHVVGIVLEQQRRRCAQRLLVAAEAVAAQAPAQLQGGGLGRVEAVGEAPRTHRQRERRVSVGGRIEAVAHADHRGGDAAVGIGHDQRGIRAAVEALCIEPGADRGRLRCPPLGEIRAGDHMQRDGGGGITGEASGQGHAATSSC
jgi:hypothetical protein